MESLNIFKSFISFSFVILQQTLKPNNITTLKTDHEKFELWTALDLLNQQMTQGHGDLTLLERIARDMT